MRYVLIHFGGLACIFLSAATQSCKIVNSQIADVAQIPEILFLQYSIKKDSVQGWKVELVNQKVSDGTVKGISDKTTFKPGDLKCIALDENKQPLRSIYIEDPLHRSIEYADESGNLTRKEVQLDSAGFLVRMQLDARTKFIAIERMDTTSSATLHITEIDRP